MQAIHICTFLLPPPTLCCSLFLFGLFVCLFFVLFLRPTYHQSWHFPFKTFSHWYNIKQFHHKYSDQMQQRVISLVYFCHFLPLLLETINFTDQTWMIWRSPMCVRWNQYIFWSKIWQMSNNHSTKSGDRIYMDANSPFMEREREKAASMGTVQSSKEQFGTGNLCLQAGGCAIWVAVFVFCFISMIK